MVEVLLIFLSELNFINYIKEYNPNAILNNSYRENKTIGCKI